MQQSMSAAAAMPCMGIMKVHRPVIMKAHRPVHQPRTWKQNLHSCCLLCPLRSTASNCMHCNLSGAGVAGWVHGWLSGKLRSGTSARQCRTALSCMQKHVLCMPHPHVRGAETPPNAVGCAKLGFAAGHLCGDVRVCAAGVRLLLGFAAGRHLCCLIGGARARACCPPSRAAAGDCVAEARPQSSIVDAHAHLALRRRVATTTARFWPRRPGLRLAAPIAAAAAVSWCACGRCAQLWRVSGGALA